LGHLLKKVVANYSAPSPRKYWRQNNCSKYLYL